MKSGYIDVTKEIIGSPDWDEILDELMDHLTIVREEEVGHGVIRFHCESDSFDELPESVTRQYDAIFARDDNTSKAKFIRFKKSSIIF